MSQNYALKYGLSFLLLLATLIVQPDIGDCDAPLTSPTTALQENPQQHSRRLRKANVLPDPNNFSSAKDVRFNNFQQFTNNAQQDSRLDNNFFGTSLLQSNSSVIPEKQLFDPNGDSWLNSPSTNSSSRSDEKQLERNVRQFVYDTNPWSSAQNNLATNTSYTVNNNKNFPSNRQTSSGGRRNNSSNNNAANGGRESSMSRQPPTSPGFSPQSSLSISSSNNAWDTDGIYEGSGSSAGGRQSLLTPRNNNNYLTQSGASNQWPSTNTGVGNIRPTGDSLYERNLQQQQPYPSNFMPSPSTSNKQHKTGTSSMPAPWEHDNSRATGGAGGTTEDDEDEWDNAEGSGDVQDMTDPFSSNNPPAAGQPNGFALPPSGVLSNNTTYGSNKMPISPNEPTGMTTNQIGRTKYSDNSNGYQPSFTDSGGTRGGMQQPPALDPNSQDQHWAFAVPPASPYDEVSAGSGRVGLGAANTTGQNSRTMQKRPPYDPYDHSSNQILTPFVMQSTTFSPGTLTDVDHDDDNDLSRPTEIVTAVNNQNNNNNSQAPPNSRRTDPVDTNIHGNNVIKTVPLDHNETGGSGLSSFGAIAANFLDTFWRRLSEEPGLLAAVIGGAVIGLLCAILLAMFLVYRMRKKDEGSYALDESNAYRKAGGYTRAPTSEVTAKEYYA